MSLSPSPLGVIADDFTGATDIAGFMVQSGWRVVQLTAIPDADTAVPPDTDAIVISLKTRSCPPAEAIKQSLLACRWLTQQAHCQQIFFKYCSTFDSTHQGNIGPVTDALMEELGADITVICPALPINGRTVVYGHLFVNGQLLNQSGMENHPITPMRDANLIRLMEQQSQGKAALIDWQQVQQGHEAIAAQLTQLQQQGIRYAVIDTLSMSDLLPVAQATKNLALVTGGSGLGAAIANCATSPSQPVELSGSGVPPSHHRRTIVLSGSCSTMTNRQVEHYRTLAPNQALDIERCIHDPDYVAELVNWVLHQDNPRWTPMLYATQTAQSLQATQQHYGAQIASDAVEHTFAALAHALAQQGINTFVIAGGETSGVIVQSLNIRMFHIGALITPGVPWVHARQQDYFLALKSGNFGDPFFFQRAQEMYHD